MDRSLLPLPNVLKQVSHEVRWNLLQLLAHSDYRGQDLVEKLNLPQNLISYHLKQLRQGQLVTERRSSADERSIFYSMDVERFQGLYLAAGSTLHPAVTAAGHPDEMGAHIPLRVLFLCTENSARSQMAEALLRHVSQGSVEAYSAGSQPVSHIHPLARRAMEQIGIDMQEAIPKHFRVFEDQHFDAIVTVCDRVVESCPTFPDDPEHVHWSFLDPASVQGTEAEQLHAFEQTSQQLTTRIRLVLPLLARKKNHLHEE